MTVVTSGTNNDHVGSQYTTDTDGNIDGPDPATGLSSGDTVRVVWTASDGSSSQTLFTRDIN